jgi:hypothetical protein
MNFGVDRYFAIVYAVLLFLSNNFSGDVSMESLMSRVKNGAEKDVMYVLNSLKEKGYLTSDFSITFDGMKYFFEDEFMKGCRDWEDN